MAGIDCLCLFLFRYESLGWEEGGDDLDGVGSEGAVFEGVTGLGSSFRGCPVESVDTSGLGKRGVAGGGVCEVETGLITSGEALSGLAMRRPPSEPDRSRSPFMMDELHSNQMGDSNRFLLRFDEALKTSIRGTDWREGFVEIL